MAKEYIEREAVMQAFSDYVWNSNHSDLVPAPQWNHAVDIVRDYPAADVVARDCYDRLLAENDELRKERPVVRGKWDSLWIDDDEIIGGGYTVPQCSVCKEDSYGTTPYCPFCGAKMDGDGDVCVPYIPEPPKESEQ